MDTFCGSGPAVSDISLWLYSTLLPKPWAAKLNCAGAHSGPFTPPRISPSCPHCLRLWLDSEYRADGVIARQLAMAAFGWVGTAGHLLLWPSLIAEMEFTAIHLPLQVVLAHPPYRLSHSSWGRQPTLLVAGYDRQLGGVFQGSRRGRYSLFTC